MAGKSPFDGKVDIITYKVKVGGTDLGGKYNVTHIKVIKDVNKIPKAIIGISDGEDTEPNFPVSDNKLFAPGAKVEILAGYHSTEKIIYKGIVVEHGLKFNESTAYVELYCKDMAAKLGIVDRTIVFKKKKDSDIIKTIITDAGKLSSDIKATTVEHPVIVQNDCTDWDFILTRAKHNGAIVLVDDGKLTIKPPVFTGTADLVVTYNKDIYSFSARMDAQQQLKDITCQSWDYVKEEIVTAKSTPPKINKQGDISKLADMFGIKKVTKYSTAPLAKDQLKAWADGELLRSRLLAINGEVIFQGNSLAEPGKLIDFKGVGKRFTGTAFISGVEHSIRGNQWHTTVRFGFSKDWMPEKQQKPSAASLLPGMSGLYNGVVVDLEDPNAEGNICVHIPVIDGQKGDGIWARMAHGYATTESGFYFMPEVGDEVLLGFLNDDPRYPVILGAMYNGVKKPPYSAANDNFIKALFFNGKAGPLKLEFNAEKDIIILETPGGNRVTLDDDKKSMTLEDPNKNKVTLSDAGIVMNASKDFTLKAKGKVAVQAKSGIELKCTGGDVKIAGINVEAKGRMAVKIQAAMVEAKGSASVSIDGSLVTIN